MKKLIAILSLCMGLMGVKAQENYTLTVKVNNLPTGNKFFLFHQTAPGTIKLDSTTVENNNIFVMKGSTAMPQLAFMYIQPENSSMGRKPMTIPGRPVYLQQGNIMVNVDNVDSPYWKVGGTRLNNDLQSYNECFTKFLDQENKLYAQGKAAKERGDNAALDQVSKSLAEIASEKDKILHLFFNSHLDSEVSLRWLMTNFNLVQQKNEVVNLFGKMSKRIQESRQGKRLAAKLQETQAVGIGSIAPDFKGKDNLGKEYALKDFRGKYVLLDFWASWCVPCRRENPNVLRAYNQFKNKNFTIVGFSLDNNKLSWNGAVKQDKLPWTQISDLLAWRSPVASLYGVQAIPSNFLIDPSGKIIAINLRGTALENKLAEILK